MDERLRFVARLLDGEAIARSVARSAFRARPATRSSSATKNTVWRP
jgi:hypothetical protein